MISWSAAFLSHLEVLDQESGVIPSGEAADVDGILRRALWARTRAGPARDRTGEHREIWAAEGDN